MPADFRTARFFCLAGGTLALAGLVLWGALPIHLSLPPYLFTAVLAGAYGYFCWKKSARSAQEKKEPRE
jgi:nicotinamide riboside transporter PnuC